MTNRSLTSFHYMKNLWFLLAIVYQKLIVSRVSWQGDLSVPNEAMDSTIRFLAMLVGPFYPFLALFRAVR